MNIKNLLISLAVIIFCVSCKSPKEIAYFQDTTAGMITQIPDKHPPQLPQLIFQLGAVCLGQLADGIDA